MHVIMCICTIASTKTKRGKVESTAHLMARGRFVSLWWYYSGDGDSGAGDGDSGGGDSGNNGGGDGGGGSDGGGGGEGMKVKEGR